MNEYDGIVSAYIPQCAVCENVDGAGCKAFMTNKRERKYYDSRDDEFAKCHKFKIDQSASQAERFKQLAKSYKWK